MVSETFLTAHTTCVEVWEETILWKASLLLLPSNALALLHPPPPKPVLPPPTSPVVSPPPATDVDAVTSAVIDSSIGKPTQIGLNFFPFPDYSQLMRKPAWGHIEAGRESKFVFFLRRVDIRFILLLQPLIPNFLFFCLPKLILLGYPIKN